MQCTDMLPYSKLQCLADSTTTESLRYLKFNRYSDFGITAFRPCSIGIADEDYKKGRTEKKSFDVVETTTADKKEYLARKPAIF